MFNRVYAYFEKFTLFFNRQFGFQSKQKKLMHLLNSLKNWEAKTIKVLYTLFRSKEILSPN